MKTQLFISKPVVKITLTIIFFRLAFPSAHAQSPCNASFTLTKSSLSVTVNNTSTGSYTYVSWEFGDGTGWITTATNPYTHSYNFSGTYGITLGISNTTLPYGCDSTSKYVSITKSTTGIGGYEISDEHVNVFPNPFTTQTTFSFSKEIKNASLIIYDLAGKEEMRSSIPNGAKNIIVERGALSSGMYFYTIISEGKTIAIGKLVVSY